MVDQHGDDGDELQGTGSEYPIRGKFSIMDKILLEITSILYWLSVFDGEAVHSDLLSDKPLKEKEVDKKKEIPFFRASFLGECLSLKSYKLFGKKHKDLVASGDKLGHFVRIQRFVA